MQTGESSDGRNAPAPSAEGAGAGPGPEPPRDIAVALSGGGHRATLFALGVLLYLVDTGMNRRVRTISSVSGGSITNGFVAQECDFGTVTPEAFDRVAGELLERIVRHGLFHRSWQVVAYLLVLVLGLALAASATFVGWPVEWPLWLGALVAVGLAALALLRGMVISLQLGRRVLSRDGRKTPLAGLGRTVEHLFCATDITSGVPFYFSTAGGGYVYSPALGKARLAGTRLAGLTLSTAVRASAAFPGGIPPKRLVLGDVRYTFRVDGDVAAWQTEHTRYREVGKYRPRLLFLADGGVWNNLGTQAFLEHRPDRGEYEHRARGMGRHASLIVVNASAPMRAAAGAWRLHVPLYADFATLVRSLETLNSNTVDPRIAALRERRGCTVISIADVRDRAFPYAEVSDFKHRYPDDADLQRLKDDQRMESWSELRLLDTLGHESLAWHCSALPTSLGRLKRADALRLVIHAYQNALGEFFAVGGPRPRPSPPQSRFTRLIAPRGRESDSLSVDGKVWMS